MTTPRRWLVLTTAVALSLQTRAARAEPPASPSPSDAAADGSVRLFREGRRLLNEGRPAEACERFNASLQLKRSPGTLLNVGQCRQSSGDLTGALRVFEEALGLAEREPDAQKADVWSTAARTEIANIERRLSRVVVTRPLDVGVRVELDGSAFTRFGEPARLNPGQHRLVASADGKASVERNIELVEGQTETVELPELTPSPAPPPRSARPVAAAGSGTRRVNEHVPPSGGSPLAPMWIAGIGGAVLLSGGITAGVAAKEASDLKRECPNRTCDGSLAPRDSVYRTAVVADVLMATGLVGVAVGTIWLLTADTGAPALDAACDLKSCSAVVHGRF